METPARPGSRLIRQRTPLGPGLPSFFLFACHVRSTHARAFRSVTLRADVAPEPGGVPCKRADPTWLLRAHRDFRLGIMGRGPEERAVGPHHSGLVLRAALGGGDRGCTAEPVLRCMCPATVQGSGTKMGRWPPQLECGVTTSLQPLGAGGGPWGSEPSCPCTPAPKHWDGGWSRT